jgi:peptidoglycan/LPS O-acetylase OafA/YrhL
VFALVSRIRTSSGRSARRSGHDVLRRQLARRRLEDGYWDLFVAPSPLEHMWSLAIEEQFYDLAVRGLRATHEADRGRTVARGPRRLFVRPSAGPGVLTAMVLLASPSSVERAYLGTDTRAADAHRRRWPAGCWAGPVRSAVGRS